MIFTLPGSSANQLFRRQIAPVRREVVKKTHLDYLSYNHNKLNQLFATQIYGNYTIRLLSKLTDSIKSIKFAKSNCFGLLVLEKNHLFDHLIR